VAGAVHRAAAVALGRRVTSPLGHGPASWHPGLGLSTPVSQMRQSPLPPSLTGENGPALVVRVGPAGADAAKMHLHHGGSPDTLIEAAALSLQQAAMVHGSLDPARYAAWVQHRLAFLSQIPDAAAIFGTIDDAQHTIGIVMAHRSAGGGAVSQAPGQPSSVPSLVLQPSSRSAPQPNALLPVAQSAVPPRSAHSSLYSR